MEEKKEESKKNKRKVSIFTVFLWLLLIIIMSVILITGIYKQNAYEYEVDENLTGVQVTFSEETSLNHEEFKNSIYLEIYYEKDGTTYCLGPYYNDELAGQTVIVPSVDFYVHMYVNRLTTEDLEISSYDTYGFKIDKIEGYTGEITEIGIEKKLPSKCKESFENYGYEYPESNHYPTNYNDYIHYSPLTYAQFLWKYHFINDNQNTITLKVKPEFYDGEVQDFTEEYENIKVLLSSEWNNLSEAKVKIEGNYQGKDQDGNYVYQFTNVPSGSYHLLKEWMYVDGYYQLIKNGETNGKLSSNTYNEIESDIIGEEYKKEYGWAYYFITDDMEVTYIDEYYKLSTAELRVKVESNAPEEKLQELIENTRYYDFRYVEYQDGYYIYKNDNLKFIPFLNEYYIYGVNDEDEYLTATYVLDNDEEVNYMILNPGKNIVYLKTIYSLEETYIKNEARWIDEKQGIAEINFSYTSTNKVDSNIGLASLLYDTGYMMFTASISEDFVLSSEYENDPNWIIIENSEELADLPIEKLLLSNIYVKEQNMIGRYILPIKKLEGSMSFHVVYKNKEEQSEKTILQPLKIGIFGQGRIIGGHEMIEDSYIVDSPNLVYLPESSKIVQVEFKVNGIPREEKYYVGLFKDETSTQAEEVKEITLENLVGNVGFEVSDDEETYFVYMTDENGNKLENNDFVYEGNEVDFNEMQIANVAEITTDKSVVSSVKSGSLGLQGGEVGIEETTGTGEENYIDNVLNEKEIYIANVSISKTYETERFNLGLEKEWQDNEENRPNEVKVILYANGIEVEKITLSSKNNWKYVVENLAKTDENGKEIKYTVTEEKVDGYETRIEEKDQVIKIINVLEEAPDTSDIAIWKYVVVAGIASVVIVLVIIIVKRKKK